MKDVRRFDEVMLSRKPISECRLAASSNKDMYRLYFLENNHGFDAKALEFVSCEQSNTGDLWKGNNLEVRELFTVTAYFDGARHLEFNRESADYAGYIYYPSIQGLNDLFSAVRQLEKTYCRECEEDF